MHSPFIKCSISATSSQVVLLSKDMLIWRCCSSKWMFWSSASSSCTVGRGAPAAVSCSMASANALTSASLGDRPGPGRSVHSRRSLRGAVDGPAVSGPDVTAAASVFTSKLGWKLYPVSGCTIGSGGGGALTRAVARANRAATKRLCKAIRTAPLGRETQGKQPEPYRP